MEKHEDYLTELGPAGRTRLTIAGVDPIGLIDDLVYLGINHFQIVDYLRYIPIDELERLRSHAASLRTNAHSVIIKPIPNPLQPTKARKP